MKNQFSIDFSTNTKIEYKDIKKIKKAKENSLLLSTNNEENSLYFEKETQREKFFKNLQKKL